jgi:hypothetical protein
MQIKYNNKEKKSRVVLKKFIFNGKNKPDALIVNFQYLASNKSGLTSNTLYQ